MKKIRVLLVSTAHPAHDPRIVFKQCPTLADTYEVFCALPHADPTAAPTVRFIPLPYFRRVIWRVLLTGPLVLLRCLWLRPGLVHVSVPEFLPFAYIFRLFGAKIVYEVQENLYRKLHLKTINRGYLLDRAFRYFDRLAQRHFYLIFTEHGYLKTYTDLSKPHEVVYNYPLLPFLEPFCTLYNPNANRPVFFYIGRLSIERSFDTLVEALAQVKETYPYFVAHLFGPCSFTDKELSMFPRFGEVRENLNFYGYTNQRLAFPSAQGSTTGLALLNPVGDYPESYTTKLFEYMALGLPVVTANFSLYQAVIDKHACGFCVPPYDPAAVAQALLYLIHHPAEAQAMGQRGQQAVRQFYNWNTEARKLLSFYERVLGDT